MKKTMRGRPRLNIEQDLILEAVRRHRQVVGAARELGCSDGYIHVRLKEVGLSLRDVLDADNLVTSLDGQVEKSLQ